MSQYRLFRERRFAPFFLTQFLGAFNDNLFKSALLIYIAYQLNDAATLVNAAQALFIAPFFIFSSIAGQLADKVEKSRLMQHIKLTEIAIMGLGAFALTTGEASLMLLVLFLMGAQSAFFGPVKYAVLPQVLADEELVGGNGLVEMGTFLAILLGTLVGGVLIGLTAFSGAAAIGGLAIAVAVAGWLSSRTIPPAPAAAPELQLGWNLALESWRILRVAARNQTVFNSILGISWFWGFGAVLLAQLPSYAKEVLGAEQAMVTWLLVTFSVGIGVGSLACEKMSGRLIEIGLVPFGAFGMSLFGFDLVAASGPLPEASLTRIFVDLFGLSLFGGFFIVPLYALIQSRSEPAHRSRIIAANNILNALFVVIASVAAAALLGQGLTIPQVFLVIVTCNVAVAIYIFTLVPEFLMRFIVWMLVHTVYRLEIDGIDQVPDEGPAVIACNHVSFVDALVITAACRRPIRFIMDHRIYQTPILHFVFRVIRAIPIASRRDDPAVVDAAFDEVAKALADGDLVGIFPEGRLTSDGKIAEFRPGIEKIVANSPVPVIPMALRGLWGSFFSRDGGAAMSKPMRLIRQFRAPVALAVAPAIEPSALSARELEATVAALRGDLA